MGFNKVYKSLLEIFPQIDARVLRAVAIEHSKDIDVAAEAVLLEVVPFLSARPGKSNTVPGGTSVGKSSEDHTCVDTNGPTVNEPYTYKMAWPGVKNGHDLNAGKENSSHDANDNLEDVLEAYSADDEVGENTESCPETNIGVYSQVEALKLIDKDDANASSLEKRGSPETHETRLANEYPKNNIDIPSEVVESHLDGDVSVNEKPIIFEKMMQYPHLEDEFGMVANEEVDQGKPCTDRIHFVQGNASGTAHESEGSIKLVMLPNPDDRSLKELDESSTTYTSSELENSSRTVGPQHELAMDSSMSLYTQKRTTDVLEELIEDAKNNKKTLLSAMQSVIILMTEVELKEKSAERAKAEAAMGDIDVLAKVEELKQMAQHAEEANCMHGGEVYGEKAILATELRELHHRVLSLSDERDKYLNVLDEMRKALEMRLALAENEMISAEQEKVEKGKAARKAQAEQELVLERLMQETEILKQQAEDNAKLQEFLMDRGLIVDALQGEIAVICQDVRLLKEKFDDNVPFSKSLSSSQTCYKLASSCSSFRSMSLEQADSVTLGTDEKKTDFVTLGTDEKKKDLTSECGQPLPSRETALKDDMMALLDDGWEVFDTAEAEAEAEA